MPARLRVAHPDSARFGSQDLACNLDYRNQRLRELVAINARLTALAAEGASPSVLCEQFAARVGMAVCLLDPLLVPKWQSESFPPSWRPTAPFVGQVIGNQPRLVGLPPMPDFGVERGCLLAAIHIDSDVAGYVAMLRDLEGCAPNLPALAFDELTLALEHLAGLCSLAMLESFLESKLRRMLRDDAFAAELTPTHDRTCYGSPISLLNRRPVRLVCAAFGQFDDGDLRAPLRTVELLVRSIQPEARVIHWNQKLIVELFDDGSLSDYFGGIIERLQAIHGGVAVQIGISPPSSEPQELPRLKEQAIFAARVAASFPGHCGVMVYEELKLHRLLAMISDEQAKTDFVRESIGLLLEYDSSHSTEFTRTAGVFAALDRSLPRTADQLGIHRNTAAYRLERIREIASLDLRNIDDALVVRLALILLEDGLVLTSSGYCLD